MVDTMKLIDDRVKALGDLYKRMDETKDFLYWKYQLKNFEGQPLKKTVSVTPNQPKVFTSAIIADLMGGKWQTVVEGKLTSKQAHTIEMFLEDNLAQIDEFLLQKFGMPSLNAWNSNHICIRGWIGGRFLSIIKDGQYQVDYQPCDMRWTPFELGEWWAPITFRSKSDIEAQYPKAKFTGTENIEVRNFWGKKKHEIWVERNLVIEEKNPLGYPPFVGAISPSGFMLRGEGYLEHEGEDLLFLNRDLYEELARSISIEQTLGMDILVPPLQYGTKNFDGKPARKAPKSGEVSKVPEGEEFKGVPRGDMNTASLTARADIKGMIQEGGPVLPRAYTQPPSALEVTTEAELLGKLYNPRKEALRVIREQLLRMIIDQFLKVTEGKGTASLSVGERGRKVQYSSSQLGDPETYTISCQLMTKSKRQEVANLAMFVASRGDLPLEVRLKDILMADDPAGIMRQLEIEKARTADPALALFEMALRYAEEAEEIEDDVESDAKKLQSKMLTERGVVIIKERMAPAPVLPEEAVVPKVEQPKPSGQTLMPLLGQGGMGRGGNGGRPTEEVAVE